MAEVSPLTGEAAPVSKSVWNGKAKMGDDRPGGDNRPFIYSGALITRGHGLARTAAIGAATEIGKIGKSLDNIKDGQTVLSREVRSLAKIFGIIGLTLCVMAVGFYWFLHGRFLEGFLYGLTIGMSMLPEEFPVVMVVFLALGAWRISKRKVLTRNPAAIEALGAVEVLCTDKTGTLTINQMRLRSLASPDGIADLADYAGIPPPALSATHKNILGYALLASQTDPFDPMEKEIKNAAKLFCFRKAGRRKNGNWLKSIRFPAIS
jgi:Cation transport ATPase